MTGLTSNAINNAKNIIGTQQEIAKRGVHIVDSYAFSAAKTTEQQTSILPQTFSLARDRHLLVRVPEHIFGLLLEQLLAEQLHLEETIL